MAALTEERRLGDQQAHIVRPMRVVAGRAALGDRRMFPEDGPRFSAWHDVQLSSIVVPALRSFTFVEPCTLWHDEHVILPSARACG